MSRYRRLFLRIVSWSGFLAILRFISDRLHLYRSDRGECEFPFIALRKRRALQILIYHRVNDRRDPIFPGLPTAVFDRQMAYLAQNYCVFSLDEAVVRLKADDLPNNALAITLDDGYRDNFTDALPILRRYGLPATIFLATDAIGTGQCLWQERVFSAFRDTQVSVLAGFADGDASYALNSPVARRHAMARILNYLWDLDEAARCAAVTSLLEKLQVGDARLENNLMLDWEDAISMLASNITFGAHTMSHPILSRLPMDRAREEIVSSKTIIENRLGSSVKHFAYPVGGAADFDASTKALLQEVGFQSAVTTLGGINDASQDIFELRRATPWDENIQAFALRLCQFKFVH